MLSAGAVLRRVDSSRMNPRQILARRLVPMCCAAVALACATAAPGPVRGGAADGPTPRGSLFIVGGGPRTEDLMRRFVELAGGLGRARIVVFPMATTSAAEVGPTLASELRQLGASAWSLNLTREDAMRDSVARGLDSATGIWFAGGDQNRIMAALGGTP